MATRKRTPAGPVELNAAMRAVLLHGKENYLRDQYTKLLTKALEDAHGEIERFDYDGDHTDVATILDELRSYGLMQQHKLVVVDAADKLVAASSSEGKSTRNPARAALETYTQQPVEHATLVLRADTWRKGNLDKYITKIGAVIKCEPPNDRDAAKWCVARAQRRYDVSIAPAIATQLVERVGSDLNRLDMELVKLATASGSGGTIDAALLQEMVGRSREEQAWAIQQSLGSADPARALGHLVELFEVSRVAAEPVSWSILDLLRKVAAAQRLLDEGVAPGTVAKSLRLWPQQQADMVIRAARGLSRHRCAQLLQQAIDTDRRNKTGFGEPMRSLEALTMLVADEMKSAAR